MCVYVCVRVYVYVCVCWGGVGKRNTRQCASVSVCVVVVVGVGVGVGGPICSIPWKPRPRTPKSVCGRGSEQHKARGHVWAACALPVCCGEEWAVAGPVHVPVHTPLPCTHTYTHTYHLHTLTKPTRLHASSHSLRAQVHGRPHPGPTVAARRQGAGGGAGARLPP